MLVGINYTKSARPLKGCVNDTQNVKEILTRKFGFVDSPQTIITLTDEGQQNPNFRPTKVNIINALKWLVADAQPGDSLFFHFSGHGGQQEDTK